MKMNTLSYGLMALLTDESYTGYELMIKMKLFWHVTHSSIYPVLSALEKEKLVEYRSVEQSDKPDKKIYSVTDKGIKLVIEWLKGEVSEPKVKDEMLLKIYCINLLDSEDAIKLIEKREKIFIKKLEYYNNQLNIQVNADETKNIKSPHFSKYILILKAISIANEEVNWCKQIIKIYKNRA